VIGFNDYKKRDSKALRVVHIISGDLWAGAEAQVFQTLRALRTHYHGSLNIHCLLFNDGILAKRLREENLPVSVIDETKHNIFIMLMRINAFFRAWKPDIVHVHHIKEHFLALLGTKIARIVPPIVRTLHGMSKVPKHVNKFQYVRSSIVVGIDHWLVKFATDVIIAVSMDLLHQTEMKHIRGDIRQIYNAIDVTPICPSPVGGHLRQRFGAKGRLWVVTATRLVEPKNLEMLIETGAVLRDMGIDIKISIFGTGPLEKVLKRRIQDQNLEYQVELHGFTSQFNDILCAADIFVLCSRHEGLPMALIEAMSMGIPVVCTDVGGMKEVVINQENGLLVQLNDVQAMAEAIHRLSGDRTLARSLAENAKATVNQRYDIRKNAGSLCKIYQSLRQTCH